MRKRHRKLDLHRDTLARLEPGLFAGLATEVGDMSSCTYECGCGADGCSAGGAACWGEVARA